VAESDVELALALGVGRRRVVPFVGESPGVERREDDWVRWVRDELEARSVVVDAERELADPLGYGEGKDSERAGTTGLPEGTGGVKGRSSPPGREMSRRGAGEPTAEKARRLPSFVAVRGCPSESAIPGVFSERTGERPRGARETNVDVGDDGDGSRFLVSDTVGSISHFGHRCSVPLGWPHSSLANQAANRATASGY
jgi:hypothetical protein